MRLPASSIAFKAASRRSFATSSPSILTRARPSSRILLDKSKLQQNFCRTYVDVAPLKKPRRFQFFRFLWRLTYISAIGGTAYLAYGVYEQKHPDEQFESDPTKKTLVILGLYLQLPCIATADPRLHRNWVGCRISSQETRHRKLQCYCHLSSELLPLHTSSPVMYHRHRRTSIDHGTNSKHTKTQESCSQIL
jgi:hypothetical protein